MVFGSGKQPTVKDQLSGLVGEFGVYNGNNNDSWNAHNNQRQNRWFSTVASKVGGHLLGYRVR